MSTQYDEETTKQLLDYAQEVTGCHLSNLFAGNLYALDTVLVDVVPSDMLKQPSPEEEYYRIWVREPGAQELFSRVHQHLHLPEHHTIQSIYHYLDEKGTWYWDVRVDCETEPFPIRGIDASRMDEGIYLRWEYVQRFSCHGIGKGHSHE